MADGPTDNPGQATAEAPEVGTSQAAASPAAQGAGSGGAAAPVQGTTEDSLVEVGTTQTGAAAATGPGRGAGGGQTPEQRAAYLQQRYDQQAQVINTLKRQGLIDEAGNVVQRQAATQAAPEVGQQAYAPSQQQAPFDPQAAYNQAVNEQLAGLLYQDPVSAFGYLAQMYGLTGQQGQQMQGLTPEQIQAMADERAAAQYQQMAEREQRFDDAVEGLEAELNAIPAVNDRGERLQVGTAFLSQRVKLNGVPTKLERALPAICQSMQIDDPLLALERHPVLGPQLREHRKLAMRAEVMAELQASGQAAQLPSGGSASIPPEVAAAGSSIESIGGALEPLRRDA